MHFFLNLGLTFSQNIPIVELNLDQLGLFIVSLNINQHLISF